MESKYEQRAELIESHTDFAAEISSLASDQDVVLDEERKQAPSVSLIELQTDEPSEKVFSEVKKGKNVQDLQTRPLMIRLFKGGEPDDNFIYNDHDMRKVLTRMVKEEIDCFEIEELDADVHERLELECEGQNADDVSNYEEIGNNTPIQELFSLIGFLREKAAEASEVDENAEDKNSSVLSVDQDEQNSASVDEKEKNIDDWCLKHSVNAVAATSAVKAGYDDLSKNPDHDVQVNEKWAPKDQPFNLTCTTTKLAPVENLLQNPELTRIVARIMKATTMLLSELRAVDLMPLSYTQHGCGLGKDDGDFEGLPTASSKLPHVDLSSEEKNELQTRISSIIRVFFSELKALLWPDVERCHCFGVDCGELEWLLSASPMDRLWLKPMKC